MRLRLVIAFVVGISHLTCSAGQSQFVEVDVVTADVITAETLFGSSVALSGNLAIAGALGEANPLGHEGAAYIFEQTSGPERWKKIARIVPEHVPGTDSLELDQFGSSVAISESTAIVGAPTRNATGSLSGLAYVFNKTSGGWQQSMELAPADAGADQSFGQSIALAGSRALIGAPAVGFDSTGSGAAYVFEQGATGNWGQAFKLTPSDAAPNDAFGYSVALDGDRAIVGAFHDNGLSDDSGSAYIFERDLIGNWNQVAKLTASDQNRFEEFGGSVALSGDLALVGAAGDNQGGADTGAAYLFKRASNGSWSQLAKLRASDPLAGANFGSSIALQGGTAIIGAYAKGGDLNLAGAVYVFEDDGSGVWLETDQLTPHNPFHFDYFGTSVALDGSNLFVGAYGKQFGPAFAAGAGYFFAQVPEPSALSMVTMLGSMLIAVRRRRRPCPTGTNSIA